MLGQRQADEEWDLTGPLLRAITRRLRPGVGWPLGLLALIAASTPALAASESSLRLPLGLLFWVGLIGCIAGMRAGRPQAPARSGRARRLAGLAGRVSGTGLGGVVLLAAANDALPPLGLVFLDLGTLATWLASVVRSLPELSSADVSLPPFSRSWLFLTSALPRAWEALRAAPDAGRQGARLILATISVGLNWPGALIFGWALASRRALLGWGLPLLTATLATTTLGGGSGVGLLLGLAALLLAAIVVDFQRREQSWAARGVSFSDTLLFDVTAWSGLIIGGLMLVAWLLPTSLDTLLARWLWDEVEVPSGIAALERQARPQPSVPAAEVGISRLPALELGISLAQGPPEQLAATIRLDAPLPASPEPHHWRTRVFNLYNGSGWTTDARIRTLAAAFPASGQLPATIRQHISDQRPDGQLLLGLPEVIAVSQPVQAEYLADGTLAAMTRDNAAPYMLFSQIQSQAPVSLPPEAQPDLSAYLQLPQRVPPRVHELAQAIAGQQPPSAQALALEEYLRALPYSYAVQPLPSDGEAVDQFLFTMRSGYCSYYASAMAVMARSLGIPARIAIGYHRGPSDAAGTSYIIYEEDAHAWPELYIDGRWQAFEPTPIRPLPARRSGQSQPSDQTTPAVEAAPPANYWPWLLAGLVAALALLLGIGWLRRGQQAPLPLVSQVQIRLEEAGARRGISWPPGATLHEYSTLLARELDTAAELREATELITRARYSGHGLTDEQQQQLRAYGEQIWAAATTPARRRSEPRDNNR